MTCRGKCPVRMFRINFPGVFQSKRAAFSCEIACHFDMCGDHFCCCCLNDGQKFFCFFQSFFLILRFQADTFSFMIDLIAEIISSAFFLLINSSGFQFDLVFLSHFILRR